MKKFVIVSLLAAALGGCAGVNLGALVADAIPAATALATDAGVSGIQAYIAAGLTAACDADAAYDAIVAAMNKQPNATVAQIAAAACK